MRYPCTVYASWKKPLRRSNATCARISAISKRLDEANKKYRSATEQIALLKPEAHKAEALAKQVQGREAELAAQQKSSRELLEAKTRISQELDEVKQRLDEANKKYRAATEQNALLKPEAQKPSCWPSS